MILLKDFTPSKKTIALQKNYVNSREDEESSITEKIIIDYISSYFTDLNDFLISKHNLRITRDIARSDNSLAWYLFYELGFNFKDFVSAYCPKIVKTKQKMSGALGIEEPEGIKRQDVVSKIKENKSKKKTFFVTSVIPGFDINHKFLESINTFCEERHAELVLIPMKGLSSDSFWTPEEYSKIEKYLYSEYSFNRHLKVMDMGLKPNQIIPLTGLDRLGQKDYSLIVASPKQQMNVVPVSSVKLPHLLQATGTLSSNKYYSDNRIGRLAVQDHVLGGIVVEVDNDIFHIRQVQSQADSGYFVDLNTSYCGNKIDNVRPLAFYLGDSHAGWEDTIALEQTFKQIELLQPSNIMIGDLFDGTSCSHHTEHDIISQVNRPDNLETLEKELHYVAKYLKNVRDRFPKLTINIIRSNHDEHLDRYLREARYSNDRMNHRLALQLATDLLDQKNPIEEWVKKNYPNLVKNINWLTRNSSIKICGIEIAKHGDKGSNGSKATPITLEKAHGSCVVGHRHTPGIFRNVWIVGTLSKKDLPYTEGSPSSWLHTNCSIYEEGQRQLLNIIEGKWKLDRK